MRLIKCDDPDNIGHSASAAAVNLGQILCLHHSSSPLPLCINLIYPETVHIQEAIFGYICLLVFWGFFVSAYAINSSFGIQILDSRCNTMVQTYTTQLNQ